MSVVIKGMKLPKHVAVNGEKDTAYKCVILAHPDNSVELVIDSKFASPYDNGHNIQLYPIIEIPTPHGRLIDADALLRVIEENSYRLRGVTNSTENGMFLTGIRQAIDESPTIIEAEVSE